MGTWRNGAVLAVASAFIIGEGASKYDNQRVVNFAKQNLRARYAASQQAAHAQQQKVAWLEQGAPKFPFLVAISPGDNPATVANGLLSGARVIGSYNKSTGDTLTELLSPSLPLERLIHTIAARWNGLKALLHGNVPAAFDPRVSSLDSALNALLTALKELHPGVDAMNSDQGSEQSSDNQVFLVFFLRDVDNLNDSESGSWMKWIHSVTSGGLAHVVIPTTNAVTPAKIRALQLQHSSPDDFVSILLRVAKGAVDVTTAEDKLRELSLVHGLHLKESSDEHEEEDGEEDADVNSESTEMQPILDVAGNWWSDIKVLCEKLEHLNLGNISNTEERLSTIHRVCNDYVQESMAKILQEMHLDGTLAARSGEVGGINLDIPADSEEEEKALGALESWKCLEVLSGVVAGRNGLVASAQTILVKGDKPLNCVNPVDALMPFNHRAKGEAKFLELIDKSILFLRPKNDVEIGVVPCESPALVSPCWVEIRPIMKKAFEKIWRNDVYFNAVQDLERVAINKELRREIALYAEEIAERRQNAHDKQMELLMRRHIMSSAEESQRKAEVALLEVEIASKEVYLEKLRSLLLL